MGYNHNLKVAIVSNRKIATQLNLARVLGIQPAKVSRVINGEDNLLSQDEKTAWAKTLDVPVAQIFGAGLAAQGENRG